MIKSDISSSTVTSQPSDPKIDTAVDKASASAALPGSFGPPELREISAALGPAPPAAYAAAHAYPEAAPAFNQQPLTPRPNCQNEPLRLYVHIPFCNYS